MMKSNKIYGLVLSGGKSTRMGVDKDRIPYYGIPHREYLYDLLKPLCSAVFMSVREEQALEMGEEYPIVLDQNEYKGPFNGMLSAHALDPEASWLVLACDLPLIDRKALEHLTQERDPRRVATAFATRESGLPEPLCAVWEPMGLQLAREYLDEGNGSCPRKFLLRHDTKLVYPHADEVLLNANYKEDYEQVLKKLSFREEID